MKWLNKCLAMLLSVIMILSLFPAAVGAAPENSKESAILSVQDGTDDVIGKNSMQDADKSGTTIAMSSADEAGNAENSVSAAESVLTENATSGVEFVQAENSAPATESEHAENAAPAAESVHAENAAPAAESVQAENAAPAAESAQAENSAPAAESAQPENSVPAAESALSEDTTSVNESAVIEDSASVNDSAPAAEQPKEGSEQTSDVSVPVEDLSLAEDTSSAEETLVAEGLTSEASAEIPTSEDAANEGPVCLGDAEHVIKGDGTVDDETEEPLVGASTQSYKIKVQYGQTEARSMLAMVNKFRTGSDAWYWAEDGKSKVYCKDLQKLTYDYELEKAAMIRAMEIAVMFSHTRPNGGYCGDALDEIGYDWERAYGENIAIGYSTGKSAYMAWREDDEDFYGQGHRRNMLNSMYNRIAIGHAVYNGINVWVQEFAYKNTATTKTSANDSYVTGTVEISDEFISSASVSSSVKSITVGMNKSCNLPTVTAKLSIKDGWFYAITLEPICQWTTKNSKIATVKSGKLVGVTLGNTKLTTTAAGKTVTVSVTVKFVPVKVGDNVTADVVLEGNKYVLYFTSKNGTLWNNWKDIVGSLVNSVNEIKFSSDSGKMYLPANSSGLFSGLKKLTSIDTSKINTSKVTNAKEMFKGCSAIKTLDMSTFGLYNVSEQANATDMFNGCTSLTTINTPKKVNPRVNVMLPATFVDDNGSQYVRLPIKTSGSIKIVKYDAENPPVINISNCTGTLSEDSYTYDGTAKKPSVVVTHSWVEETADGDSTVTSTTNKETLTKNTDYTVKYSNNVNAGTATVSIVGKGKYTGTLKKTFAIARIAPVLAFAESDIQKTNIDDPFTNKLTKTTDGTVTFKSSDTSVATVDSKSGKVTPKWMGTTTITATAAVGQNYKAGSVSFKLTVIDGRMDISGCKFTISPTKLAYDGKAKKPFPTVVYEGATLKAGTDYTVTYTNNVNVGKGTAKMTGKGKYKGSQTATFTIVKGTPTLKFAKSTVTKADFAPSFTNKLTKTTDGTVTFKSSNKSVAVANSKTGKVTIKGRGTATITVTAKAGKNYNAGSAKYTLKVVKKEIVPVYRLFNTRTGEHFYTASTAERKQYLDAGNWASEGIAWYAPKKSSQPIYRLSNPNNGNEHHYTKSKSEKDWLVSIGWKYDTIAWYSDTDKYVPIYRHYHPIQRTGNHHYTTSKGESNYIVKNEGWKYEGISFYVSKAGG